MTREEVIAMSFDAYFEANKLTREAGDIDEAQKDVYDQFGEVVKAVVAKCPKISDSEVMALLSLSQDLASQLLGAVESSAGKRTVRSEAYRKAVAPVIAQMLLVGAVREEDLPEGVAPKAA